MSKADRAAADTKGGEESARDMTARAASARVMSSRGESARDMTARAASARVMSSRGESARVTTDPAVSAHREDTASRGETRTQASGGAPTLIVEMGDHVEGP